MDEQTQPRILAVDQPLGQNTGKTIKVSLYTSKNSISSLMLRYASDVDLLGYIYALDVHSSRLLLRVKAMRVIKKWVN